MKRKILYSLLIVMMALPALVKAQSPGNPVIYKEWASLGESSTQMDVSYRVIKCTSVNQIHLQVFNENPNDQTAHFELEITNTADGQKFNKEIIFATKRAEMYTAECNSDTALNVLKLDLPSSYDPTNLTLKITFKL